MKTVRGNPLDKTVMMSFTPHDAAVVCGALDALLLMGIDFGRDKRVLQDTIASMSLQFQGMRQSPDPAKKAP